MLTFKEYKNIIEDFMSEMQATCAALTNEDLQQHSQLRADITEFKQEILNRNPSDSDLVGLAFGLFDNFLNTTQEKSLLDGYALYKDKMK